MVGFQNPETQCSIMIGLVLIANVGWGEGEGGEGREGEGVGREEREGRGGEGGKRGRGREEGGRRRRGRKGEEGLWKEDPV